MAVILTVDNSYSHIQGLTAQQEKALRGQLSYIIGGNNSYFSGYGVKKRSLLTKKGEFPTGLVHRVIVWLGKDRIQFDIVDLRVKP